MQKLVTLVKRRPGVSVEDFAAAWARSAERASRAPGLIRYEQNDCLAGAYRKGEPIFDGVGEIWVESAANLPALAALDRDNSAFAAACLPVDVHVIKDGDIPADGLKSFEFVTRLSRLTMQEFRNYWLTVHGPLACNIATFARYEQNHTSDRAYEGASPAYDGLAATWFASIEDMRRGPGTPAYEATRADEENFLTTPLPFLITRERVVFAA